MAGALVAAQPPRKRIRARTLLLLGVCIFALGAAGAPFQPLALPGLDFSLIPESERPLTRVVIGLEPNVTRFLMLPSTEQWDPRSSNPQVRYLRRQLYWLNLELEQGRIFSACPLHSTFFVAVPEPGVDGSLGNEREVFTEYLERRVGWSAEEIARRIRFYSVPVATPYPQDQGEMLGRDALGRMVLGLGQDIDVGYLEPARRLATAFPKDFTLRELPDVNTEGGDIELVWLPEGHPGVMVGRHRVLRWAERALGEVLIGRPLKEELIQSAREAFRRAFFGLEVIIAGERFLRAPGTVSDALFHMDMVVNVLRVKTQVLAFVPAYTAAPLDSNTLKALAPEVVHRAQVEYDSVAGQLARRGYQIVRLPLADHPVRNPVNVAKLVSPEGQPTVLLGKYPYSHRLPDGRVPQRQVQLALDRLTRAVESWREGPTEASWQTVRDAIDAVWRTMDEAFAAPNPTFTLQADAYRAHGVEVIAVPMFVAGEGGIHCSLLQ